MINNVKNCAFFGQHEMAWVKWTRGSVGNDAQHPRSDCWLPCFALRPCRVCVCVCEPSHFHIQHKGSFWSSDLLLIVFQLHCLKPPAQPQHTCIYFTWSWSMISSNTKVLLRLLLRCLSRHAATFLSISTTASIVNPQHAWEMQSDNSNLSFFLPRWLTQKLNWYGEDMSTRRWHTCIRLTCHYLHSFPIWPAIIKSQLRRLRDYHGAGSTEPGTPTGLICRYPLHKQKQLSDRDCAQCIPCKVQSAETNSPYRFNVVWD